MSYLVVTLFLVVCVLLIVVVLLQKGRGGGLSAALGGMGSSAFGTRVGDVMTWVTIVLVALFLLLAVGVTLLLRPEAGKCGRPIFAPAPGHFTEPLAVEVGCATPGVTIHYTLDGNEPTDKSPAYEGPIRIEPPVVLTARAYRPKWEPSEVTQGFYGPQAAGTEAEGLTPATVPAEGTIPVETPATLPVEATPLTK
jgi:preprotein translocase subunit SecG